MLNGNLANYVGTTFGVRCDGFLVEYHTKTLKDKVINAFMGKNRTATLNERALSLMNFIFRETEYTVDLVVDDAEYTADMQALIADLPFNRIVVIKCESDIVSRLMSGDLSYYVDGNLERLSKVMSTFTLTPEAAFELVRSAKVGRDFR